MAATMRGGRVALTSLWLARWNASAAAGSSRRTLAISAVSPLGPGAVVFLARARLCKMGWAGSCNGVSGRNCAIAGWSAWCGCCGLAGLHGWFVGPGLAGGLAGRLLAVCVACFELLPGWLKEALASSLRTGSWCQAQCWCDPRRNAKPAAPVPVGRVVAHGKLDKGAPRNHLHGNGRA